MGFHVSTPQYIHTHILSVFCEPQNYGRHVVYSFQILSCSPFPFVHNSADQTILLVPNIRRAMVEYHDILWDLGCKFFILSQSCCLKLSCTCILYPPQIFSLQLLVCFALFTTFRPHIQMQLRTKMPFS